jgi:thiamine biosynthesis lipoprotein
MLNSRFPLLCAFLVALLFFTGCTRAEPSRAEFVMGTVCSVTLYDQAKTQVYRDIFSRLREIEDRMSANLPDSDVTRVNAAAGVASVQVHNDVFDVIERALFYAEISGGAFDPTVGPLVSLWGIGGDDPRVPTQEEIDAVLPLVNWRDVELDRERRTVFLRQPGMALDLGGIAKGYAADEAAALIRQARLKRAIIDLGGNIMTFGVRQDGRPWRVGIQNPLDDRGAYIGIVEVRDRTVVTSGVYERNFEADGVLYHHIFSPFDGYPISNGLLSVTIIADTSIDADALSTAVFVMGYERGMALIESLEGIEGIFVFEDMSVRKTEGVELVIADESYRLLTFD